MSDNKMLKISNYEKLLNGAHPLYTCETAEEFPTYYKFVVQMDNDNSTYINFKSDNQYTFKLSRKEERSGGWILTILWGNEMEYTVIQKNDMGDYKKLFYIMCGMIDEVNNPTPNNQPLQF